MRNKRFEEWFASRCHLDIEWVKEMYSETDKTYLSYSYNVDIAYKAWCAALGFEEERDSEDE